MNANVNLNNDCDYGFQALLYYKFIISGEHDVALVSERMGISHDTLYRYVRRALPFPIDRLADLVKATGDSGFLEYFAKKCGHTLIPTIKDHHQAKLMIRMAELFLSACKENSSKEVSGEVHLKTGCTRNRGKGGRPSPTTKESEEQGE